MVGIGAGRAASDWGNGGPLSRRWHVDDPDCGYCPACFPLGAPPRLVELGSLPLEFSMLSFHKSLWKVPLLCLMGKLGEALLSRVGSRGLLTDTGSRDSASLALGRTCRRDHTQTSRNTLFLTARRKTLGFAEQLLSAGHPAKGHTPHVTLLAAPPASHGHDSCSTKMFFSTSAHTRPLSVG